MLNWWQCLTGKSAIKLVSKTINLFFFSILCLYFILYILYFFLIFFNSLLIYFCIILIPFSIVNNVTTCVGSGIAGFSGYYQNWTTVVINFPNEPITSLVVGSETGCALYNSGSLVYVNYFSILLYILFYY